MLPRYYSGNWLNKHYCFDRTESETLSDAEIRQEVIEKKTNYMLFIEDENLEARVARMQTLYPELEYRATIEPSYIDRLLRFLNPKNQNEIIYIYRFGNGTT